MTSFLFDLTYISDIELNDGGSEQPSQISFPGKKEKMSVGIKSVCGAAKFSLSKVSKNRNFNVFYLNTSEFYYK